jgi:GNAT superfamily N-acetyltransferase
MAYHATESSGTIPSTPNHDAGTPLTRKMPSPIANGAVLTRPGIDDLARVRAIHAAAVRVIAGAGLTERELHAFDTVINSPMYTDRLARFAVEGRLLGLKVSEELVATAAWGPSTSSAGSARLDHVCTLALFGRLGLGSRLVVEIERQTLLAGFHRLSVRTFLDQIPFFERLGFTLTSHSALTLTADVALPVAFMRKASPRPAPAKGARPH